MVNKKLMEEADKKFARKYMDAYCVLEREKRIKVRNEVLRHYGGRPPKCACCGEKEILFLSIDHILGGGNKHRKKYKIGNIHPWLKRNGFPDGYQVLCYNCNMAKGFNRICPHKGHLLVSARDGKRYS